MDLKSVVHLRRPQLGTKRRNLDRIARWALEIESADSEVMRVEAEKNITADFI